MKKIVLSAAAIGSILVASGANAAPLLFSYASNAGAASSFSFTADSEAPDNGLNSFSISNVPVTFGGSTSNRTVNFYNTASYGGLQVANLFNLFGAQLYTSEVTGATFKLGSFNLFSNSSLQTQLGTLSIAAVPEPATWAMMLVGFAMVGAASRYRRRNANVAYA